MSQGFGNPAWHALSDKPRWKPERSPRGRGPGWLAAGAKDDKREPPVTYRQLMARRVADSTTEDTSIQRVLRLFWAGVKCETCKRVGPCEHRQRAVDLAEIEAERI